MPRNQDITRSASESRALLTATALELLLDRQRSGQMQSTGADLRRPYLYRARNLVERFLNSIIQCRRVATRYDKLAANYLAFVRLASIRLWLRAL